MWFAISEIETILGTALHSERPDTRRELPFKSPECERIERLVLADCCLVRCSIVLRHRNSASDGKDRPIAGIWWLGLLRIAYHPIAVSPSASR